jgi:hypothetical protein
MKKLTLILLMMCCLPLVYAQKKGDSHLIKRDVQVKSPITPVVISGAKASQADSRIISITPLKLNIKPRANEMLSKDLAIDQFQISYEPMLKRYTLKCRIFNAGTTDIDLKLLSYYAHGSPNTLGTAVSKSDPAVIA